MKKEKIILIGGGGHCHSVIDVIEQENRYTIAGIIDANPSLIGKKILGYEVIGTEQDLEELCKIFSYAFVAIGQVRSNEARVRSFTLLKSLGFSIPSIVSPLAYISKHAKLGEGSIVMHHALINANAVVKENCIINTKALLEHDVVVCEHSHISTGAILNGGVRVDANSFIGSNASSREGSSIGGFVKAGSVAK